MSEVPEAGAGEDAAERYAVGVLVRQPLTRLPRQQRPCSTVMPGTMAIAR
jgi:hypothetical protein